MDVMTVVRTRVTADGRVSVPAQIRQRLGAGPGSVLVWEHRGNAVVIRKAYSSADIHRAIFSKGPTHRPLSELNDGIRRHMANRYARR
jgi:AbrB family looped-hinge helix DNA binding protein